MILLPNIKRCISPFVLSLFSSGLYAMDISEAWEALKIHHPSFQQVTIALEKSDLDLKVSRRNFWPSLSATYTNSWDKEGNMVTDFSSTVTQPIYDKSKFIARDQAEITNEIAQLNAHSSLNELALQVINAYMKLASAQDELKLAENKLKVSEKLLAITEQRFKAGQLQSIELTDMRTSVLDDQVSILNAEANVLQETMALSLLVGNEPGKIETIRTDFNDEPAISVNTADEWFDLTMQNNISYRAAKKGVLSAQYAVAAEKASDYPSVSASATYSRSPISEPGIRSYSLSISVPFEWTGAKKLERARSKLAVVDAEVSLAKQKLDLKNNVQAQFLQLQTQWRGVEIARRQVAERERLVELRQAIYHSGRSDASDLINANNSLFSARIDLKSRFYEYWQARINLLNTAGVDPDKMIEEITMAFAE